MKWYEKLWQWLTIFLSGVIAGIVFYIKVLDKPENEIFIKRIKNKNSSAPVNIDVTPTINTKTERNRFRISKKRKNKV